MTGRRKCNSVAGSEAGVAQWLERHVANVDVVSSNLIARLTPPGDRSCQEASLLRTRRELRPAPRDAPSRSFCRQLTGLVSTSLQSVTVSGTGGHRFGHWHLGQGLVWLLSAGLRAPDCSAISADGMSGGTGQMKPATPRPAPPARRGLVICLALRQPSCRTL